MSRTRTATETGATPDVKSDVEHSYNPHTFEMDWARVVRFTAPTLGLAVVLGGLIAMTLGGGCASTKPDLAGSASNHPVSDTPRAAVLDVGPARTAAPAYAQAAETPAPPSAPLLPDPASARAPTLVASADPAAEVTSGGSSYTVQHGDTLFRIAKQHYGDGKQWSRIASANPGVTPANLRAGQKIVLP